MVVWVWVQENEIRMKQCPSA